MDRQAIDPRTRQMHLDWRVRNMRRAQAQNVRREREAKSPRSAVVVAVNAWGDVQLDRFTDENGVGDFFAVGNGKIPKPGQPVAYIEVEGSPAVIGAFDPDDGEFSLWPDPDRFEAIDLAPLARRPSVWEDKESGVLRFQRPIFRSPAFFEWAHFFREGAAGEIPWEYIGAGSATKDADGHLTLASSAANTSRGTLYMGAPALSNRHMSLHQNWEAWFWSREPNTTTNYAYWIGVGDDATDTPPADFMGFEYLTSVGSWYAKHYNNAVTTHSHNSGITHFQKPPLFMVGCHMFPDAADPEAADYELVWEMWDIDELTTDERGVWVPTYRHTTTGSLSGSTGGQPFITIQTLSAAVRSVPVTYVGGWFEYPN